MLCELEIKNLAIIESQSISFSPGLNVISGETGAGKSIILEALQLVLGQRANSELIRTGAENWEVQASFDISKINESIKLGLPDFVDGDELLVFRSLNKSARAKIYVNGHLSSLSILNNTTSHFINICSQGQQIQLLNPDYHLTLVDNYAELKDELTKYKAKYYQYKEMSSEIQRLEEEANNSEIRLEELNDIIKDLTSVKIHSGIRASLQEEVEKISNSEKVFIIYQEIKELLNNDGGLLEQLITLRSLLNDLKRKEASSNKVVSQFETAKINFDEFENELESYISSFNLDEEKLDSLRDHLAEVARFERKYKTNDEGLVLLLEKSQQELEVMSSPDGLAKLKEKFAKLEQEVDKLANKLLDKRKKSAKEISKMAVQELEELNLKDVSFVVNFTETELNSNGNTKVEFLISTNKGEPEKSLKKVASGGELSRIMLVLKKILNENSGVNVLVFDEVDSGVSGSVARAVGEKLKALSQNSQVICITHLPQVASLADHHYLVEKTADERTITQIRGLNKEERIEEIARMLSGHNITETSRASARELIG